MVHQILEKGENPKNYGGISCYYYFGGGACPYLYSVRCSFAFLAKLSKCVSLSSLLNSSVILFTISMALSNDSLNLLDSSKVVRIATICITGSPVEKSTQAQHQVFFIVYKGLRMHKGSEITKEHTFANNKMVY
jgi:hypothetical protein